MPGREAYEGLSNLAHAIRRSTAAYVAMSLTPPEGTLADWEVNANHVANWIKGKAGQAEEDQPEGAPLGMSWDQRDGA